MLDLSFDRLPLDRTTGTDTRLTVLVGAAVLFFVLYRSIPLSLLMSKPTMQRSPTLTVPVQGREMTIDPSRLHKPNFGYDVTVSKLLIHPIKVNILVLIVPSFWRHSVLTATTRAAEDSPLQMLGIPLRG